MEMKMAGAEDSFSSRGMVMKIMPIPPVEENCRSISAGPVTFVVESRLLNAAIIDDHTAKHGTLGIPIETDTGASLHVYGSVDGLEYLRFDCFEKQPHYHYLHQDEQLNQILTIDDVAADPVAWTLFCVRNRLPEMLDYAGAKTVAAEVRSQSAAVTQGLDRVAEMIGKS